MSPRAATHVVYAMTLAVVPAWVVATFSWWGWQGLLASGVVVVLLALTEKVRAAGEARALTRVNRT